MAKWWEQPGRVQEKEGKAIEPGRWWSPIGNTIPPVRAQMAGMPDKIVVKDETLREGEKQPFHKPYSVELKARLARELEEAGITETHIGFPQYNDNHRKLMKALKNGGTKMRLHALPRPMYQNWKQDLDMMAECGADILQMNFPGPDAEIFERINPRNGTIRVRDEHITEDFCEHVTNTIKYAKSLGLTVAAGVLCPQKTPLDRVAAIYKAIADAGADRAQIGDGYGCVIPESMKFYVRFIKAIVGPKTKITIHCHNDFGLANANTIAAVTAGAEVIDLSVNGLGERAGIAALEVVVPVLEVFYGVDTGIKMDKLKHLSAFVQEGYGIRLQQHYPVVGDSMWVHLDAPHIGTILAARKTGREIWSLWNVVNPEELGAHEEIQFTPVALHKGPESCLTLKVQQMGLSATDKQMDDLVAGILAICEKKYYASEKEVERLIQEIMGA